MKHKISDTEFINAVAESFSIRQVLLKLNIKPAGGNYQTVHKRIKTLSIDISHFRGQLWNKGMRIGCKYPIEDYLNNKRYTQSHRLKLRLINEGYFSHKCSYCQCTEWLGKPIPIELDHINGNNQDNSLSNLRLLCPNCHAQTANYRGKNIRNGGI